MSLDPGSKLGSYEILLPLGVGGMGEVYRARDTKLGRDVAIKVLPAEVTDDAERLGRFKREAQVLASLNHPHIAAIHGLEEDGARPFLVLELVEGQTLAERLSRGPLSVEDAVELSEQIAEALEQAHGKGIVHRDLKPANIKITPEGQIKVLDFGLAKAFAGEDAEGDSAELSQSPTLSRQTAAGVILGTAAYMSPEQARGKTVDKRADIWAFGVVLFEMLTGSHLFTGETVSDVLADVLRADIDWAKLPAETPPGLHRLLRRTLTRDPNERLHDIADARLELRDVGVEGVVPIAPAPKRSSRGMIAALLLAAVAFGSIATWMSRPEGATGSPPVRFAIPIPAAIQGNFLTSGSSLALSPDGAILVFASQDGLHLRRMHELDFRRIEGTDGGYGPFFSPDSEWLGFFADGRLKKVSLANGAVLTLCDARQGRGGAWREDGMIFFAPDARSGLFSVSAAGGEPKGVSRLDPELSERSHRWPSLLPGGERAFATIQRDNDAGPAVAVVSLDTGELEYLVEPALDGRYLPSGHILYAREGVMLAAPFDLDRMEIVGVEVPVLADLALPSNVPFLQVSYGLSRDGVLAYMLSPSQERELVLVDLDGNKRPASTQTLVVRGVSFAPDGRRAAVGVRAGERDEVWLLDLERELLTRMSSIAGVLPVWSPDGRRIAVSSTQDVVVFPVEEDTPPETWVSHPQNLAARDWTPDGRAILYAKREAENWHIGLTSGDGDEHILLDDPFAHGFPTLSPDGSWLAYQSNENGPLEIFVRAFPAMDKKQQVSTSGGREPHWSPDGTTLFYLNDDFLMSAPLTSTVDRLVAGRARALFRVDMGRGGSFQDYDIAPDGKTFLFISETDESAPEIRVVLNGLEELTGAR